LPEVSVQEPTFFNIDVLLLQRGAFEIDVRLLLGTRGSEGWEKYGDTLYTDVSGSYFESSDLVCLRRFRAFEFACQQKPASEYMLDPDFSEGIALDGWEALSEMPATAEIPSTDSTLFDYSFFDSAFFG
jgi:hypothetical protein